MSITEQMLTAMVNLFKKSTIDRARLHLIEEAARDADMTPYNMAFIAFGCDKSSSTFNDIKDDAFLCYTMIWNAWTNGLNRDTNWKKLNRSYSDLHNNALKSIGLTTDDLDNLTKLGQHAHY